MIKQIPVKDKAAAIDVMNSLIDKYQLIATDPDNMLDVSNEELHVFYDSDSQTVTIEHNDKDSLREYWKELLAEFPTLF